MKFTMAICATIKNATVSTHGKDKKYILVAPQITKKPA